MDLSKIKKIHMIGIKGVGMTMLAEYLFAHNFELTGSDIEDVFMTDKALVKSGIEVRSPFSGKNIPKDADLIVYSTAYNAKNNPELAAAFSGKIKTVKYAEMLSQVFNQSVGIAIAGTHGKTTTAAWLGYVLHESGKNPNVMVGAYVPQFEGLAITGQSDLLIAEVDEYQNKIKHFNPKMALLNNIDFDHPDFFSSKEEYSQVFFEYMKSISSKGFLIANFDDEIIRKTAYVNSKCKVISYAIDEHADYIAYDIKTQNGRQYFKVKMGTDIFDEENASGQDGQLGDFVINLSGRHNVYNALAVIAASIELGLDLFSIRKYLGEFAGTSRRMEFLGSFGGAKIYDDYAHHPTEIKATISAFRDLFKNEKIRLVFHPHTFSRTKAFLDDFVESFCGVDELILLDIYGSAREKKGGVHSLDIAAKIKRLPQDSWKKYKLTYIPTVDEAEKYLRETVKRGEVVVTMGAGDVFKVGKNLVKNK